MPFMMRCPMLLRGTGNFRPARTLAIAASANALRYIGCCRFPKNKKSYAMQLHIRTIPSAYRHFVLALGIRRKSYRFIAASCALVIFKHSQLNPCGVELFFGILYCTPNQFFSQSISSYIRIDYHKPKPNRTFILFLRIAYDEMSYDIAIRIYCC